MSQEKIKAPVTTTGHVWDDDLQEFNNPLPTWWIWGFYLTFAFTIIYWLLYPAWPVGGSFTKGIPGLNTISYTATTTDGKEVEKSVHWNSRAKFMVEMNELNESQKKWFDKVASMKYEEVSKDADLMQFVNSAGKTLFSDNCAPCHQQGGQGKIGFSPNLTDDYWKWGGTYEDIHGTLQNGHQGYMPPFREVLTDEQITHLASYVLQLSGDNVDAGAAKAGEALFRSETAACYYCHGDNAKGRQELGSENLTDRIWMWANVPGAKNAEGRLDEVKAVISGGLARGVMPSWNSRLTQEQIKLLTVYVHDSLGGGK